MSNITIIGSGSIIGSKADHLKKKEEVLTKIGFNMPKTVVLTEGFFNDFYQRSGIGNSISHVSDIVELERKIVDTLFIDTELEAINDFCDSLRQIKNWKYKSKVPTVVRSSAMGDSSGTGIYTSIFGASDTKLIQESIKGVLTSYHSRDAVEFRRVAKLSEGLGVILQETVGQTFRIGNSFAPIISGYGFSSDSQGKSKIGIVSGLGGGVMDDLVLELTRNNLDNYNGNLFKLIADRSHEIDLQNRRVERELESRYGKWNLSLIRQTSKGIKGFEGRIKKTQILNIERGYQKRDPLKFYGAKQFDMEDQRFTYGKLFLFGNQKTVFENFNFEELFNLVQRMEQELNESQYFEWAMIIERDKPVFYITQVSDFNPCNLYSREVVTKERVERAYQLLNNESIDNIFLRGNQTVGSGIKHTSKVIRVDSRVQWSRLDRFNAKNNDYVLSLRVNPNNVLPFAAYSNASVILLDYRDNFGSKASSHLEGRLRESGKLFAVVNPNDAKLLFDNERKEDDLSISYLNLTSYASEKLDQLVIVK